MNIENAVKEILRGIGEDPEREGLLKTPARVAKAYAFMTEGYAMDVKEVAGTVFTEDYDEMVLVKDIELYSLCEHHMLPFFGKAHVAYVPNGKVLGLSKIARVVDVFARRLQVQERLTGQIADAIQEALDCKGVAVVIEAAHMCMMMRGVQKQNSMTITSAMRGCFMENQKSREEFLSLVKLSK
jgi:GTP cyclohydrolase I